MKIGRNDPCHCGSGMKYKKCHLDEDEAQARAAAADAGRPAGPPPQMLDFVQPLLEKTDGSPDATQKVMELGSIYWNLALASDESRERTLSRYVDEAFVDQQAREAFRVTARWMIDRHRQMFPELHRRRRR
jgi:hypothetical protein